MAIDVPAVAIDMPVRTAPRLYDSERALSNLIWKAYAIWACIVVVVVLIAVTNALHGKDVVQDYVDTDARDDYVNTPA